MRKPEIVEKLYLDFDGFFASVMQQAYAGGKIAYNRIPSSEDFW